MDFLPQLIAALIAVESGGAALEIGDGGRAYGCLQIHAGVVKDVNRVFKRNFRHKDAFDPAKAQEICRLYLIHYATPLCVGKSDEEVAEICARIWNGGPRGYRKQSTLKYWKKVRKHIYGQLFTTRNDRRRARAA